MLTFGNTLSPSTQFRSRNFGQNSAAAAAAAARGKQASQSKSESDNDEKEQTTNEIDQDPLDQAHLASSQGEPHELYDIDTVSGARNAMAQSSGGKHRTNLREGSHVSPITPNLMIVSPKNHHKQHAIQHLFNFDSYNNNKVEPSNQQQQQSNSKNGKTQKQSDDKISRKVEKTQKKKQQHKQPQEMQSINASIWPSLSYNSTNPFQREQISNQLYAQKSKQIKKHQPNLSSSTPTEAIFEVILPGILACESAANYYVVMFREEQSVTIRQMISFGLLIFFFVFMTVRFFIFKKTAIQHVQIRRLIRIILIVAYFECRNTLTSLQDENIISEDNPSIGAHSFFGQIYFGACTYILAFQPKFEGSQQGYSSNEQITRSLIAGAALTYIALNFGVQNASTIYAMSGFAILMVYSIVCGIYSLGQQGQQQLKQESIFARDSNDIFNANSSSNSAVIFSPRFGGGGMNDFNGNNHSNPTTTTISATAFTSTNVPAPKTAPAISQALPQLGENVIAHATFHGNLGDNEEENTKKEESKNSKRKGNSNINNNNSNNSLPISSNSTKNNKNNGLNNVQRKGSGVDEENSLSFGSCAAVDTRECGMGLMTSGRGLMDGEELYSESLSARNNEEFSDLQAALENHQLHIKFDAVAAGTAASKHQHQEEVEEEKGDKDDEDEEEEEEEKRNEDFAYGNYARDDDDDDDNEEDEEDNENQDSLFDFEDDKNTNSNNKPRRRNSYSRNNNYSTSKNASKSNNQSSINGSLISGLARSDVTCTANETDTSSLGMTAQKSKKSQHISKAEANNYRNFDESSFFRLGIQDMILSNVSTGVIVMNKSEDLGESLVYANSQACRFLQCPAEQIMPTLQSLRNLLSYKSDEIFNFSEVLEQFEVPSDLSNLSTLRGLYMNLSMTKECMICVVPSIGIQAEYSRTYKKQSKSAARGTTTNAQQQQYANAINSKTTSSSPVISSVKSFFDMNRVVLVEVERVRGPQNRQQQSKQQDEYVFSQNESQSKSQKQKENSQIFNDRYVVFTIREIPKWNNPLSIIHTISLKIHYFIRKMISELSIDMGDIRDYFINLQDAFNKSTLVQQQQQQQHSFSQPFSQLSSHSHSPNASSSSPSSIGNSRSESTPKVSENKHASEIEATVSVADSAAKSLAVAEPAEVQTRMFLNHQIIGPRVDIAGCVGKIDCMSEFLQDFATSSLLISGTFVVLRKEFNLQDLILVVVEKIRRRTTASNYSFFVHYDTYVPKEILSDEKRLDRIFYNLLLYFVDTCEAASIRVKVGTTQVGLKKMLKVVITCEKKKRTPVPNIEQSVPQNGQTPLQDKSQSGSIEEAQKAEQTTGTSTGKATKLGESSKVSSQIEPKTVKLQLAAKKAMITNVQMLESMHYGVLLSSSLLLKLEPNDIGIIFESGLLTSFSFRLSL